MYDHFTTEFVGLPELSIVSYEQIDSNQHVIDVFPQHINVNCPWCEQPTHTHEIHHRLLRHRFVPRFGTVFLRVPVIRRQCNVCHKTFSLRYQGIPERGRATVVYQQMAVQMCKGRDLLSVSRELDLPYTTLERWFYKLAPNHLPSPETATPPNIVCLDEFAVRKGHRYAINLMDHQSGHIWIIGMGRSRTNVKQTLQAWPFSQPPSVVVTDLAPGMAETVKNVWPQTKIVADKFHVIQLFSMSLESARKQSQCRSKHIKGRKEQRLIHSPVERLKPHEQEELKQWLLKDNRLRELHESLQQMRYVYAAETKEEGIKRLQDWLRDSLIHHNPVIQRIGKTIAVWRESIESYFEHRVTNAPIEGTHNKIKVIKRRAYGYRNIEHFLIRIRLECKSA